jgi:Spy/CpxP family protein refolding chaperone
MQHPFLAAIGSGLFLTTPIVTINAQASPLTDTFPALQGIELTPIQYRKLTVLSNQTLAEVRAVLTPSQRVKFNRSLATGVGVKKSLLASNLSLSQKLQLRNLLAPKQQQLEAILTSEQQQQARNNVSAQR